MKGFDLEYLSRNNQGLQPKNFQESAIENKDQAIEHQHSLPLSAGQIMGRTMQLLGAHLQRDPASWASHKSEDFFWRNTRLEDLK